MLAFADEEASTYATGGGWLAHALREWKLDVVVIDIPRDLRDEILAAQAGQKMVNANEAEDVALSVEPSPDAEG